MAKVPSPLAKCPYTSMKQVYFQQYTWFFAWHLVLTKTCAPEQYSCPATIYEAAALATAGGKSVRMVTTFSNHQQISISFIDLQALPIGPM